MKASRADPMIGHMQIRLSASLLNRKRQSSKSQISDACPKGYELAADAHCLIKRKLISMMLPSRFRKACVRLIFSTFSQES